MNISLYDTTVEFKIHQSPCGRTKRRPQNSWSGRPHTRGSQAALSSRGTPGLISEKLDVSATLARRFEYRKRARAGTKRPQGKPSTTPILLETIKNEKTEIKSSTAGRYQISRRTIPNFRTSQLRKRHTKTQFKTIQINPRIRLSQRFFFFFNNHRLEVRPGDLYAQHEEWEEKTS